MTGAVVSPTTDTRAEYTAGLRELADLLDANPGLALPWHGRSSDLLVILPSDTDHRTSLADWSRALPGTVQKNVRGSAFDLIGHLRGLRLCVIANRDEVCERVVTGTREVTESVPDPSVSVPLVEVTKTVEDVEWICQPILSGRTGQDSR